MEDHATISVLSCQRFGVFDQGRANSLPLQFGDNGHLPHPNVATFKGPKHKASHQPIAKIAGNVVRVLFGIQFFSGELEAQGPSQDRIPEIHRRPVFGRTVCDLADCPMFVHRIVSLTPAGKYVNTVSATSRSHWVLCSRELVTTTQNVRRKKVLTPHDRRYSSSRSSPGDLQRRPALVLAACSRC